MSKVKTERIKTGDIILVVMTIVAAAASMVLVSQAGATEKGSLAIVEVNGKEAHRLELSENQPYRTLTVQGTLGSAVVAAENGGVWVIENSCRDKLCIGMGTIDSSGQGITCLPNRVVIRVTGNRSPSGVDTVTE